MWLGAHPVGGPVDLEHLTYVPPRSRANVIPPRRRSSFLPAGSGSRRFSAALVQWRMNRSWKELPELNRRETRGRPITLGAAKISSGLIRCMDGTPEPMTGLRRRARSDRSHSGEMNFERVRGSG